jgi:hypothetical protein
VSTTVDILVLELEGLTPCVRVVELWPSKTNREKMAVLPLTALKGSCSWLEELGIDDFYRDGDGPCLVLGGTKIVGNGKGPVAVTGRRGFSSRPHRESANSTCRQKNRGDW